MAHLFKLDLLKYLFLMLGFTWNLEDFRDVPDTWIPASGVQHEDGHPVPDEHGHIPGNIINNVALCKCF